MRPFIRRVAVTMAGGVGGGVALTILIHELLQVAGVGNGQYVFVFLLIIPLSVVAGVLGSLMISPPRPGLRSQLSGICVGGLLSLVVTSLLLWLIAFVGVQLLD